MASTGIGSSENGGGHIADDIVVVGIAYARGEVENEVAEDMGLGKLGVHVLLDVFQSREEALQSEVIISV